MKRLDIGTPVATGGGWVGVVEWTDGKLARVRVWRPSEPEIVHSNLYYCITLSPRPVPND